MNAADHVFHTVAVYLPWSNTRVHVTCLVGTEAEVLHDAKVHVQNFAAVPPAHWHAKVVARHEITDIPTPEPT